jgi:hypothetical protein
VNLISAAREIQKGHKSPLNQHVFNSFVVHYREFADFFSNKRKRSGHKKGDHDMLAKDFVSQRIRYSLREWRRWEDHMNTHLFHLNTFRKRNSRPWSGHTEVPLMLAEFQVAWKRFFDALPDHLKAEFKEEIALKRVPKSVFADLDLYGG